MPIALPAATEAAVRRSLGRYAGAISRDVLTQATDKLLDGIRSILNPVQELRPDGSTATVGATPASVQSQVSALVDRFAPAKISEFMNLDFKIETATKVARGAGRFVAQQTDVDEYPALELYRLYDRDVPRGFQRGPKGGLMPVPNDDWPSRFRDACESAGDAAALRVLDETGRMIALKNSHVWAVLGTNRDDTLGNPFPPFAFNSGYDTDGVPRAECIELGLLAPDEEPQPSSYDPFLLISEPA